VKRGDLLLKIKSKDIKAKRAQVNAKMVAAKSAYSNAEKDYMRFKALFEQGSASQKEMDDMTTRYNMSKANLKAIKEMGAEIDEMLKYADIRAPYDGVITQKYMNEGDLASPGMPLLAIEKQSDFIVKARVPESEISIVKKGDKVKVKVKALGDMLVDGLVNEVNPSATYTGNQYEARVLLKATDMQKDKLFSGMYVSVLLSKGGVPTVMIPKNVLIKRGQLTGLYIVSTSGTAMLRWVRTGKVIGDKIEILSGLSNGEEYIKSYKGKIWDGAVVDVE
jgi:RND family efflux transporter MFP subunit